MTTDPLGAARPDGRTLARLRGAIDRTINGDKIRTGDLGGTASTRAFAEVVAKRL